MSFADRVTDRLALLPATGHAPSAHLGVGVTPITLEPLDRPRVEDVVLVHAEHVGERRTVVAYLNV
jgi:hypothetical protein